MKKLVIFLLMIISSVSSYAGFRSGLPVKWGKISTSEFSIVPSGTDASASAIVLCDYGDIEITNRTFYPGIHELKFLTKPV